MKCRNLADALKSTVNYIFQRNVKINMNIMRNCTLNLKNHIEKYNVHQNKTLIMFLQLRKNITFIKLFQLISGLFFFLQIDIHINLELCNIEENVCLI